MQGKLTGVGDSFFTRYLLTAPDHKIELSIQQLSPDTIHVEFPAAALDGAHDAFLCIDYLGDMGHAYLDGRLVSDHFANGLPWEIGLKRFVTTGAGQELILHISPLQRNAAALRYFPTGMTFRPAADGTSVIEVHSITALPEYHVVLTQRSE
jgi:hypothetical protein